MNEERNPVLYEDVLPRGWKITSPVTGAYMPANDPDLDARKPHDRRDGWKQDPKVGGMRLRMWSQAGGWTQATVNFQLTNRAD